MEKAKFEPKGRAPSSAALSGPVQGNSDSCQKSATRVWGELAATARRIPYFFRFRERTPRYALAPVLWALNER